MSAPPAPRQPGSTASPTPEVGTTTPAPGGSSTPPTAAGGAAVLKEWLDRLLVLDVFVVIAAALWFAAAVLLHARGIEAPLALFQSLWEPLFTPAIGLLMAAALLSGALGWWRRRERT